MPKNIFFQMDNCVKDNNNHHLLIVLSLRITKEVFEVVQQGFSNG
jgi:hypothetical protein